MVNMKYQVEIRNVLPKDRDALIIAIVNSGYSVYLGVDDGSICSEATDADVVKIGD